MRFKVVAVLLAAFVLTQVAAAADFIAPKNVGDPKTLGVGIQRSMTLMATSTPEHKNTVRVLFYGQSITEQNWSKLVADDLRKRFPNANLIIENRALGGFASQLLVKTAETDLYPFYPDLLIFHVYGAHNTYEDIIRRTRERTTSDVLIMTDHVTKDEQQNEETDPAKLMPSGKIWDSFMNYKHLPEVAKKYGCAILDQRNLWKQYLKDNNLHAAQLLKDGVHLNDYGCFVMAEFVKAYLVYREGEKIEPMNCDVVKQTPVAAGSKEFACEVTGNRIDLVSNAAAGSKISVLIDGKKPSDHPELYGFTRAQPKPGYKWPIVAPIKSEAPLQLEEWTLVAHKDASNPKLFTFTVSGSKTGDDGEGRSDAKFVSKSKRIVIEPEAWNVEFALMLAGVKPVPDVVNNKFSVVPHFMDEVTPAEPSVKDTENVVTIAQGLTNEPHKFEIKSDAPLVVSAIRVLPPARRFCRGQAIGICGAGFQSAFFVEASFQPAPQLTSSLLRFVANAQAFDAPSAGRELGRGERFFRCERNHVAIVRVGHAVEVFDGQVQEAHHEAADGQAVGDDQYARRIFARCLAHHAVEKSGSPVVTIGRAFAAAEAVVKPAVRLAQFFLRLAGNVAGIDFAQARIFEDANRLTSLASSGEDAVERHPRAVVW